MQDTASYLATLSRLTQLLRQAGASPDTARDVLRLLASRAHERSVVIAPGPGPAGLLIDGAPLAGVDPDSVAALGEQLRAHQVRALAIRQSAPATELIKLVRLIALDPPAADAVTDGGDPATAPARAFRRQLTEHPLWHIDVAFADQERPEEHTGAGGVERGVVARYLGRVAQAANPGEARRAIDALAVLLDAYSAAGCAPAVADLLVGLVHCEDAATHDAVRAAAIAARERLADPAVARLAAQCLPDLPLPARAPLLAALARCGAAGESALVAQLMAAEQLATRRVFFDAIVQLRAGIPLLIEALRHPQWYVARNAACLLGEMRAEQADRALATLLAHGDPRVREAAAAALVRIGTDVARAALAAAMRDPNSNVRQHAARGVAEGTGADEQAAGSLTPAIAFAAVLPTPLTAALDEEADVEVQLGILHALGRLATPDAVRRLRAAVVPDRTRTSSYRVAALEALVHAQGPQARPTVEMLREDADPLVRQAASRLVVFLAA